MLAEGMKKGDDEDDQQGSGEMEEEGINWAVRESWWWAGAAAAQLGWGISIYRKGYSGDSRFMPFKAFAVASLFVGAAATAAVGSARASGFCSVEDMKISGANIRRKIRSSNKSTKQQQENTSGEQEQH